jgi:hypothetical protein
MNLSPPFLLQHRSPRQQVGRLHPLCSRLGSTSWLFADECFSGIVCIHFLTLDLLDAFHRALIPRGFLFIETFGGQGQNYLDLPHKGQLHDLLTSNFDLLFYKERAVGPRNVRAVAVKLLAIRRDS